MGFSLSLELLLSHTEQTVWKLIELDATFVMRGHLHQKLISILLATHFSESKMKDTILNFLAEKSHSPCQNRPAMLWLTGQSISLSSLFMKKKNFSISNQNVFLYMFSQQFLAHWTDNINLKYKSKYILVVILYSGPSFIAGVTF